MDNNTLPFNLLSYNRLALVVLSLNLSDIIGQLINLIFISRDFLVFKKVPVWPGMIKLVCFCLE